MRLGRAALAVVVAALVLQLVPATALGGRVGQAAVVAPVPTATPDRYDTAVPSDDTTAGAYDLTPMLGTYNGPHGWGEAALEVTRTLAVARGSGSGFESDSDWFQLEVTSVVGAPAYLFETHTTTSGVRPVIEIYGPTTTDTVRPSNVASLPTETDLGHSPDARAAAIGSSWQVFATGLTSLSFVPEQKGTYFIRIRPYLGVADANGVPSPRNGSDGAGAYELRVKVGDVTRVAGGSRYLTAIAASKEVFPDGSLADGGTVVIASGTTYADALAGTVLAGAARGPILLTEPTGLTPAVLTEIQRLGAKHAYVLGGEKTLYTAVAKSLTAAGVYVTRIAGGTRVQTSVEIAKWAQAEVGVATIAADGIAPRPAIPGLSKLAFVTNGWGYADALSASPIATHELAPILLTAPKSLDASVSTAIDQLGITDVVVLGGETAVSTAAENTLKAKLNGDGKQHVLRIKGGNRYETSAKVALWATGELGEDRGVGTKANPSLLNPLDWTTFGVATGQDFPDALGGGVLCGMSGRGDMPVSRAGHPVLLTPKDHLSEYIVDVGQVLSDDKAVFLHLGDPVPGDTSYVGRCRVFGGPGTISDDAVRTLDGLIGGRPLPLL